MSDKASRILAGVTLGFGLLAMICRVVYLLLRNRDKTNTFAEILNSAVTGITLIPALVLMILTAPFEALGCYITGAPIEFMLVHSINAIKTKATSPTQIRDWTIFTMSSLGWAVIFFGIGIAEVEAACFLNGNITRCSAGQGTPFQVGPDTYVISRSLNLETTIGSYNNVGTYWTAADGDVVQGTIVCNDGQPLNEGGVYTNSYENSNMLAGSFIEAYVPRETCTGSGIGFEVGLSFNEGTPPLVPSIGITVGVVSTFVTTECPAKKVLVNGGTIYAITRVVTDSLTGYHTVFGAVQRPSYQVCNINSLVCADVPGINGYYNAYIMPDGTVSLNAAGAVAWNHWQDETGEIQLGQVICDHDANCWDAALSSSSCPGVSQWDTVQHFDKEPQWNYSLPYEAYSTQFMANEMQKLTASCQQQGAGLTITGAGSQPMYYGLTNHGDKTCQSAGMAGIPNAIPGSCSFPSEGNALVQCAGTLMGSYDLTSLERIPSDPNCSIFDSYYTDVGCGCDNTTCGTYCVCPPNVPITLPTQAGPFSNFAPMSGLCNATILNISEGNVTFLIAGAPCYLSGAITVKVEQNGIFKWHGSVQGRAIIYSNSTYYNIQLNWTNRAAPTHFKWETNTTPGTLPSWVIPPDPCHWDCAGEIICSICEHYLTSWCVHSKGNVALGSQCSGSFFPRGLELWLLYVITYGGLITLVVLLFMAIYKRYRTG